jgi:hypothetical protein
MERAEFTFLQMRFVRDAAKGMLAEIDKFETLLDQLRDVVQQQPDVTTKVLPSTEHQPPQDSAHRGRREARRTRSVDHLQTSTTGCVPEAASFVNQIRRVERRRHYGLDRIEEEGVQSQ